MQTARLSLSRAAPGTSHSRVHDAACRRLGPLRPAPACSAAASGDPYEVLGSAFLEVG
jgi:hypothetical protein